MKYYSKSISETIKDLDTDIESGLNGNETTKRYEKFGANELKGEDRKTFLSKLLAQFSDFLIIILIFAAIISYFIGEKTDALMIIAIVLINALLGLYQEGKAEKSLESLQKMASPTAKVIRNGEIKVLPASEIVPGDMVQLDAGDIIPADLRLVESMNLKVEESSLTGESLPVEKDSTLILDSGADLGDRINMAYMSTIVSYGRGKGVVVATGHDTEIGHIATTIQSYDEELTPLQKQLNTLGQSLGLITILVCIVVFIIGFLQKRDTLVMLMTAISLAVAAIPEGLPAIVTIVLSLGMNRMVEKNAIVKKLLAVETLGSITVICSDKTGTLTQNEMTVTKLYVDDEIIDVTGNGYEPEGDFKIDEEVIDEEKYPSIDILLSTGILVNDANLVKEEDRYSIIGDPTEGALLTLGVKGDFTKEDLNSKHPRTKEIPFDSDRKMMSTFHEDIFDMNLVSLTKGAPDIIIGKSASIRKNGEVLPFTEELKARVLEVNSQFSQEALRVLAFAYKEHDSLPEIVDSENIEYDLTFLGLMGMIDPARPEAKDAIAKCKSAGIRPLMITGDYKETAFAIAKNLGIAENPEESILGNKLDSLDDAEVQELVKKVNVFARVSPQHKVRIIEGLKANGEITSMTGDGVNDALALKKADIGVAMGITGTDVAKNTAELILTDDNFATIVTAIEEGRIIYSNIKKFVFFLLSCNMGEIFLVLASILLNLDIPLLPIQLLWLNLVTDSFPALALGMEAGEPDIMDHPPRKSDDPILNKPMMIKIVIQGLSIAAASLIAFIIGLRMYPDNLDRARTMVFTTLIIAELLRAYSSRSSKYPLYKLGVFTNKNLVLGTSFSFILLLIVLYVPIFQPLFKTFSLGLKHWMIILPLSIIPFVIGEVSKFYRGEG